MGCVDMYLFAVELGHAIDELGVILCRLVDVCELVVAESLKLDTEDGCLKGVETGIETDADVVVLVGTFAVNAERGDNFGPLIVVGEYRATITIASEGLGREERGGGNIAKRAGAAIVESFAVRLWGANGSAETLCTIFYEVHAFAFGDFTDSIEIGWEAEKVDSYDGTRSEFHIVVYGTHSVVETAGIHVESVGVDINEDGCCAFERYYFCCGEESEVGNENCIAFADTEGFEGESERLCAVSAGKAVLDTNVFGQFLFELADGVAHDKGGRIEDIADGFVNIGLKGLVLSFEVSELHVVEFLCIE